MSAEPKSYALEQFLTTEEAADFLWQRFRVRVSPITLANWRATGADGPVVHRFSRRAVLYKVADLLRWVENRASGEVAV